MADRERNWSPAHGAFEDVDDPRDGDDEASTPSLGLVMSYGANMTAQSLVERMDSGDIYVPPVGPGYGWSRSRASRFVESLMLGLPVPGICLFRETERGRHMILDGQHRLSALHGFYHGVLSGEDFRLTGVSEELMGKTYDDLLHYPERLQLDKALIMATVVYQASKDDSLDPVLSVFERLNSSCGTLSSHEMRTAVYDGRLSQLLSELAASGSWRKVYGRPQTGMADQELILRFLALCESESAYRRPMKQFLNNFMARHRDLDQQKEMLFRRRFDDAALTVAEMLAPDALRPDGKLSVPLAEAVLVGLADRRGRGPIRKPDGLRAAHRRVVARLRRENLCKGEATEAGRIKTRIAVAREEFGGVE